MNRANVEHALSMVFPDVRLKTYVEIRPADSMPTPYAIAYAALIKGLFYCDECLEALYASCRNVALEDIWRAKESLMENGYRGKAYGRNVDEICDEMFDPCASRPERDCAARERLPGAPCQARCRAHNAGRPFLNAARPMGVGAFREHRFRKTVRFMHNGLRMHVLRPFSFDISQSGPGLCPEIKPATKRAARLP